MLPHLCGLWRGGQLMNYKTMFGVLAGSLIVSGCSSTPRSYSPMLAVPPADQRAFDKATADCSALLVAGKLDRDGRLASAGVGVAAGAATMAAGAGAATAAGLAGGMAIASATVVLIPFAIIGGAVGMSKIKRGNREQAIKTAMTGCLKERGYEVSAWDRMSKAEARARTVPRPLVSRLAKVSGHVGPADNRRCAQTNLRTSSNTDLVSAIGRFETVWL